MVCMPESPHPSVASDEPQQGFEWRAPLSAWRWLILGALGASATGCGGEAQSPSRGQGGSAGAPERGPVVSSAAAGGSAGVSGSAGTSPGGAGSGSAPTPSACTDETVLEGGLSLCNNGLLHRASAVACSAPPPAEDTVPEEFAADAGAGYPCVRNADCTDKPYGRCTLDVNGPYCYYRCITDADCDAGQLCLCDDFAGGGSCVSAGCATDADCGAGNLCAGNAPCGYQRFECQTSSDECAVDSDCPVGQQCELADFGELNPLVSPAGFYRACRSGGCPIPGRPFLVAGIARSAACVERSDWCARSDGMAGAPEAAPALAPELRAAIARGWLEQALMEHASVAAFARFTLQLLAVGAPPRLVADAARAMQDEIRHAHDCFRLARRHAPSDVGPGPLPLDGALAESSLAAIVVGTVREGCVGETLAALEAAEALQHCEDEAARPVLERIAAEEARHAELAWRFVAWALESTAGREAAELRRQVREAFADELAATGARAPIGGFERELARHGLLGLPVRQALRARALSEVLAPCVSALLEATAPGSRTPARPPAPTAARAPGAASARAGTSLAC
jgi:hypothetical protein